MGEQLHKSRHKTLQFVTKEKKKNKRKQTWSEKIDDEWVDRFEPICIERVLRTKSENLTTNRSKFNEHMFLFVNFACAQLTLLQNQVHRISMDSAWRIGVYEIWMERLHSHVIICCWNVTSFSHGFAFNSDLMRADSVERAFLDRDQQQKTRCGNSKLGAW